MSIEITDWLRGLGLEQYAPAFRDNDVDNEVLPQLTVDDLISIGVTSVGHRRRLLAAIAALGASAAAITIPTAPVSDASASTEAERRQLTVMFCDLVGSTPLSTRFDPEDLREIVGTYHRGVTDTVSRFGGFVAKYMGDGVLIYFGYPEAHEDDAERAARAGLAVIEAIGQLATVEPLNVRVGIATGLVVVGDLIGAGAAQERGVVGETPNLAARLQALARPGTLVIADSTRRQIGTLFEIEDLGPQPLAGFADPQPAWRVVDESGVVSRFEALRSGTTPLVGRDEELDLLLRRWRQAKSGEGRVVLVSGEPGIGKSRLTAALSQHHRDRAAYPPALFLLTARSGQRALSVHHPARTRRWLRARGHRQSGSSASSEHCWHRVPAARMKSSDWPSCSPCRALLPASNLSPQRKREKLFEALLSQLAAEARRQPVLMVFEDAHWIDPTSRELLDLTVDRVRRLPVLLAITFRPEFQAPWGGRSDVTSLALNRLSERDSEALVQKLVGNAALTTEVVTEIIERTDGVPLFVEEMTKAVLESGDRHATLAASTSSELAIPASLHASLVARFDRLGPIARESRADRRGDWPRIYLRADRADGGAAGPDLRAGLDRLSEAGLLFYRGTPPHASYLFKHALVQDAAYGTLLRTRRQELHARVAAVLEQEFADLVDRQPELLAHHLTAAGDSERAVDQWLKAGQHATERLAHLEAIRHFERGLLVLAALPEGPARDGPEIELQLARGASLFTAKGYISTEAAEAYARARELAEQGGDVHQLFTAVHGLWTSAVGAGQLVASLDLSDRLLRLTAGGADEGLRLQAHHSAWTTCLFAGDPLAARNHCEAGRRLYDPERHHSHRLLYAGHDPGVCGCFIGGQVQWLLGYPEEGLALGRAALALAERIAHPFTLVSALLFNGVLHLDCGEPEAALQLLDRAEALATEQRLGLVVEPRFIRGAALSAQGAHEDAVACLREGLAGRLGAIQFRPYALARLAETLSRQNEHGAALATVKDGAKILEESGHRQLEAEFHRLEGLALSGLNRLGEAQAAFEEALRVARRQQTKAYELRAATSLTHLWREQGRRTEARELLAPVYDLFTEGFDTADLKDAKALLDELA